ncbi:MFS transporter [Legionella israelensis]|uniref:Proline/glycine betaine transporter-like protein n=1 Tax=Legionella israelensis TaxID=454 RepID=A0A0W0V2D4_9GAMM|nr:MFS transporter [Legionella israelensis]KTD14022.1 proline/glycine betaine transporter-like protein [Legionella israelensis]QBS09678.1 MFS transporter [Legionella israelensis]SCY04053.1 MFS transporter, MHS family, proline/betaine transporter [Legionella israelensis DSM 19235]STX60613.1 proline/glycine betaine transporter-like protein [Legionella israelensis]
MKPAGLILALMLVFLEWMDFSLYLYLAKSVFAVQFFPASSQSLMLSFAVFAAAYLARPLGGWMFGRSADRSGRRKPMMYSAALMGVSTLGICFLPEYATIGIWAAWGLLLLRVGQGLALGGEMNTSAMFLVEHYPQHRLFAGSLMAIAGAIGMFAGAALAALLQWLNVQQIWRLMFAFLGFLSLMTCCLRKQLEESPEFLEDSSILHQHWAFYWQGILNIAVVAAFVSVFVYVCNVLWVSFAIDMKLMTKNQCIWAGALAQLTSALLAMPIAFLNKDQQVSRLLKLAMLLMIFVAPALFYSTAYGNVFFVFVFLSSYALVNALVCASMYYFLYLQLPVHIRCTGVSLTWGLAASVGAASLPIAQQAIMQGKYWFPPLIVSAIAFAAWSVVQRNELLVPRAMEKKITA